MGTSATITPQELYPAVIPPDQYVVSTDATAQNDMHDDRQIEAVFCSPKIGVQRAWKGSV
jgi:hypothetical protein